MLNLSHRIRQTKEGIWVIDQDTHITKWTEELGRLDTDRTVDRICEHIPAGGVVVDAGASIGDHTIGYARKVGEKGTVFAFEPNPSPFACLAMNMSAYPWVFPIRMGLGSTSHMLSFEVDEDNLGASKVASTPNENKIAVTSLDSFLPWFNQLGRFDFFKLDVEGMESYVLCGAMLLIERFHPVIYCEVNAGALKRCGTDGETLISNLRDLGYTVKNFDFNNPDNFSTGQFDVLCTPKP